LKALQQLTAPERAGKVAECLIRSAKGG
jgi:hypothetical protein